MNKRKDERPPPYIRRSAFIAVMIAMLCMVGPARADYSFGVFAFQAPTAFIDPTSPRFEPLKQHVYDVLEGKATSHTERMNACFTARGQMRLAQGQIKYNDFFHELDNEEQIRDIKDWVETAGPIEEQPNPCTNEWLKHWVAYDDKWYAQDRKKAYERALAQMEKWDNQVVDTGDDIWDGNINGTFFAVPRRYIWFGRNEPDGYNDPGVNLLFHYPGLSAAADPEGPYGERSDIEGLVRRQDIDAIHPCRGEEEKGVCSLYSYMRHFRSRYLNCHKYNPDDYESMPDIPPYKASWRKDCDYMESGLERSQYKGVEPVFDEEVGMWRLGERGYYEGSPEFPSYFLICKKIPKSEDKTFEPTRSRCHSAFPVNEQVYFYYSFPSRMFWEHRDIQQALKEKIQSFIVKPKPQPQ